MRTGYLWLRIAGIPIFDADGTFKGYRWSGHDITVEKKALEHLSKTNAALATQNAELQSLRRQLELAAYEYPLTGLPNRRAFEAGLAELLSETAPQLAFMIVDLDRFKHVNDTLGHPAGDMVLVTAAGRIADLCDIGAKVFRIGGDEFAVLYTGSLDPHIVARFGNAIVRVVSTPIILHEQDIDIAASAGFALTKGVPTCAQRLFVQADAALYKAKRSGRKRVVAA